MSSKVFTLLIWICSILMVLEGVVLIVLRFQQIDSTSLRFVVDNWVGFLALFCSWGGAILAKKKKGGTNETV